MRSVPTAIPVSSATSPIPSCSMPAVYASCRAKAQSRVPPGRFRRDGGHPPHRCHGLRRRPAPPPAPRGRTRGARARAQPREADAARRGAGRPGRRPLGRGTRQRARGHGPRVLPDPLHGGRRLRWVRRPRRAGGAELRARRDEGRHGEDRLPRRPAFEQRPRLRAPALAPPHGRGPRRGAPRPRLRARGDVPRRGVLVVRHAAPAGAPAPAHGHPELGGHQVPAHRDRGRGRGARRARRARGRDRRGPARRRRRPHLPRHDAPLRAAREPPAADDGAHAVPHPQALLLLGTAHHAGRRRAGSPAGRRVKIGDGGADAPACRHQRRPARLRRGRPPRAALVVRKLWLLLPALAALIAGLVALVVRRRNADAPARIVGDLSDETVTGDEGAVRSVQGGTLIMQTRDLERIWNPMHLERLARTYWRFLSRCTLGLVRVEYTETTRAVVLIRSPFRLLTFQAPEYEMDGHRGIVRWRVDRGFLVARRGEGYLEIDAERHDPVADDASGCERLHVQVSVANFYPAIASGLSRWVYENTQSRIHVLVTWGFLRSLARRAFPRPPARLALAGPRRGRFAPGDEVPDPRVSETGESPAERASETE